MTFTSTQHNPSLIVWEFQDRSHTAICLSLYIQQNAYFVCVKFSIYATLEAVRHCKVNRCKLLTPIKMFQILW